MKSVIVYLIIYVINNIKFCYKARPQPGEIEDMKRALMAACKTKYPVTEGNILLFIGNQIKLGHFIFIKYIVFRNDE